MSISGCIWKLQSWIVRLSVKSHQVNLESNAHVIQLRLFCFYLSTHVEFPRSVSLATHRYSTSYVLHMQARALSENRIIDGRTSQRERERERKREWVSERKDNSIRVTRSIARCPLTLSILVRRWGVLFGSLSPLWSGLSQRSTHNIIRKVSHDTMLGRAKLSIDTKKKETETRTIRELVVIIEFWRNRVEETKFIESSFHHLF